MLLLVKVILTLWVSWAHGQESTGQCGPPPAIDNGDITTYPLAVYAPGSSVEYQCQAYYELEGNRRITCRDGQWSEPPKCLELTLSPASEEESGYQDTEEGSMESLPVSWPRRSLAEDAALALASMKRQHFQFPGFGALSCGSPPTVQNAFIPNQKPRYRHRDTARYECRRPLGLFGNAEVTCLRGKWTDPPECKEMTCPSPPSYGNAILVGRKKNAYKSGEEVTYKCPKYYQMDGSNVVQCMNGRWIGTPTCKALSCGSPPIVQNAFIPNQKPRYRHGDTARYECWHPLGLFGKAVVTCFSGKWTDPPECKAMTCPSPPSYGNAILLGQLKNSYKSGEQVAYGCPEHYHMYGSNVVECRDGTWIGTPTCKDLSCGRPPTVQNAIIPNQKPRYRHGDTARYECRHPLGLFGKAVVTCLSGKWTDPPECKEPTGQCGPPPAIDNGDITTYMSPFYASGSSVEYQCQAYYQLEGNRRITCLDGQWSEPPKCLPMTCPSPPSYDNAILLGQPKNSYKSGEQVAYGCPEHYQMYGSNVVECRAGTWIGTPTCKDVSCGSPPTVQNAFIPNQKDRYRHGDTAQYECRRPLGLFGKAVVTCLSGKWTDPPECKDSTGKCKAPPAIDNGDITTYMSPFYASGSSVEYQCQAYYELEGNRRISCRDGQWSEPPKCLAMTCPSPPSYGNAILLGQPKNSYKSGEHVAYSCPDYYQMFGSNVVECRHGTWIGTPTCKDLSCGSPPTVQNAFIPNQKPRYRHGDTAQYECRHPLGLFGKAVVTCFSGKWTDPPECKESTGQCGPPPAIDNGDVTTYISPFYASGSSVEYQCQAYYQLEGNRRITCRDGQWSEPPKCLNACVISEEIMKEHNIQLKWSYAKKIYSGTNDYVEFVCRPPYHRVSPASAFRAQCLEGKMEFPTCA